MSSATPDSGEGTEIQRTSNDQQQIQTWSSDAVGKFFIPTIALQ